MNQPEKIGRYTLDETLDLVGLGQFWRGTDLVTAEPVLAQAIPLARLCESKDRSELFRKLIEAQRKTAEVKHPKIRKILGVSRTAEMLFIFHQWRVGQSLATWMASEKPPLPHGKVLSILADVAEALEAVHAEGQTYGRLSPLGIRMDEEGAFLVDFGLAPLLEEASDRVLGKLSYAELLAPEQVSGKPADALADGYALGVLAFLLLTGAPPFLGETQEELLDNILYREPELPEAHRAVLHPNTSRVLLKALSKEPEGRFQSPSLFTSSLAKTLLEDEAVPRQSVARPNTTNPKSEKKRRAFRVADGLRAGGRRLLGLAEGEAIARQEQTLLLTVGLSLILVVLSLLLSLVQPMSRVRERLELGQLDAARAQLSSLRSRWEGEPEVSLLSAELHLRQQDYDEAITELWQVLQIDRELLREADLNRLLVRLYFARPTDVRALELAGFALEGASWTELGLQVGLGEPKRAAAFLQLLSQVGRPEDARVLAAELARRLRQRPSAALAGALMPVVATVRSADLCEALTDWLLRQGLLAEATEMLRRALELAEPGPILDRASDALMRAIETHPQSRELRMFLAEHLPTFEESLRERLEHPSALVRLGALRALETGGADVPIPDELRLAWQLQEAKTFGESPDLEARIQSLAAQSNRSSEIDLLLVEHALWRQDFAEVQRRLRSLLQRQPEWLQSEPRVAGILLTTLEQARTTNGWLETAGGWSAVPLLELGMLAPSQRLRERCVELLDKLNWSGRRTAFLIVELQDPETEDRLAVAEELANRPEPEARNAMWSWSIRTQDSWMRQRLHRLLDR